MAYKFGVKNPNNIVINMIETNTVDDQEAFEYNIENYNKAELLLAKSFQDNDKVSIHQSLHFYWERIEIYSDKFPIEALRIYPIVSLLMDGLKQATNDVNIFDQTLVWDIFHTFNIIFYFTKPSNPYQLFANNSLLQILLKIARISEDKLFLEILKFLRLIFDPSEECLFFEYSVIQTSPFQKIISDDNDYSPETFMEFVYLIDQLSTHPNEVIKNCVDIFFIDSCFFTSVGSIEANMLGFKIINNLLKQNNERIKILTTESNELSRSVKRLLNPETCKEVLLQLINTLGLMCFNKYEMNLYNLNNLIQFLNYPDDEIKISTSFALCNALATNLSQFSKEDCLNIIFMLGEMMANDTFIVISYVGQTIPKIFTVIPNDSYTELVQNGFYDILFRIASIDSLMTDNETANLFLTILNLLFAYADANKLWKMYANAFEGSNLYQILTEIDFENDQLRLAFDSFLFTYDKRKKE